MNVSQFVKATTNPRDILPALSEHVAIVNALKLAKRILLSEGCNVPQIICIRHDEELAEAKAIIDFCREGGLSDDEIFNGVHF